MNIYEYFSSKDIAEYCKSINYSFSSTETAYLIWYSDHHTLSEKHIAWQEIIDTMPDEEFHPNTELTEFTLHSFLQKYIHLQKKYTIDADIHNEISQIKIIRYPLYTSPVSFEESNESEYIVFNKKLEPLELGINTADDENVLLRLPNGFFDMWVAIPVPFKKGDIVTVKHTYNRNTKSYRPLILDHIPWWRKNNDNQNIKENESYWLNCGVDWTDMCVYYSVPDHNNEPSKDHGYCYLDLEYYDNDI